MIHRQEARRLLDEYNYRLEVESGGEFLSALDLAARRDEFLGESDLVLRGAENVEQKGRRYLTEGRLTVSEIRPTGVIVAQVRGDSGETHTLGYDPRGNGAWRCTCQAKGRCSHLVALQLVTVKPKQGEEHHGAEPASS